MIAYQIFVFLRERSKSAGYREEHNPMKDEEQHNMETDYVDFGSTKVVFLIF